jgi:release factor glutamine methyltransferase
MTLNETLTEARERLAAAGISPAEAAVDVDVFARAILGWDRARLLLERTGPRPPALEPRFSEWVTRRTAHEPTAYIVGTREFWGLDFSVTPSVLIPRPETEFIVEEALRLVRSRALGNGEPARPLRLGDIGTGSGCIAVSLAVELPHAVLVATDISADALVVARENARRHGVADRIQFVHTSYLNRVDGMFDLITANPPYVKATDKPALARDVRHEPDVALFGGETGLRHIAGALDTATVQLRPGGWFVMEFGFGQEDDVRALTSARPPLRLERVREDLQGIPRTAIIQRTIAA